MKPFVYDHPMCEKLGRVASPVQEMIDLISERISLLKSSYPEQASLPESEQSEGYKCSMNQLCFVLERAMVCKKEIETPMLKGIYQEGRYDQYHSDYRDNLTNEIVEEESEQFFEDSFE